MKKERKEIKENSITNVLFICRRRILKIRSWWHLIWTSRDKFPPTNSEFTTVVFNRTFSCLVVIQVFERFSTTVKVVLEDSEWNPRKCYAYWTPRIFPTSFQRIERCYTLIVELVIEFTVRTDKTLFVTEFLFTTYLSFTIGIKNFSSFRLPPMFYLFSFLCWDNLRFCVSRSLI